MKKFCPGCKKITTFKNIKRSAKIVLSSGYDDINPSVKQLEEKLGIETKHFKKVVASAAYKETHVTCKECGIVPIIYGNLSKQEAKEKAKKKLIKKIIKDFEENGFRTLPKNLRESPAIYGGDESLFG